MRIGPAVGVVQFEGAPIVLKDQGARGIFAGERIALGIQEHRGVAGGADLGAVGRVAGHDRPRGGREIRIEHRQVGRHPRVHVGVVEERLVAGVIEKTQRNSRGPREPVIGPAVEGLDHTVVVAALAQIVVEVGGLVDRVFILQEIGIERAEHLLVGAADRDRQILAATADIKHLGVGAAHVGPDRTLCGHVVHVRPAREIARADRVGHATALRHRQRRAGLEIELAAERIRPLVGGLTGDDLDLLIHRSGEGMQRGRTSVAADARRGHPVHVEAGEGKRLTANADVHDEIVLVGLPTGDAGQPGHQLAHVLGRQNAPFIERGHVLHVGRVTLFGEGQGPALLDRLDREGLHGDDIGRLQLDIRLIRAAGADRDFLAALDKARVGNNEVHHPGRHPLHHEATGIVGELDEVQRGNRHRRALEGVAGARARHRARDRPGGGGLGLRGRNREGGEEDKQARGQTPQPGNCTDNTGVVHGSDGFAEGWDLSFRGFGGAEIKLVS